MTCSPASADGLTGFVGRVREPRLRQPEHPLGLHAVGDGLVVQATGLGLEVGCHLGGLAGLLLGLLAHLVGDLLGMHEQPRGGVARRLAARIRLECLHCVHEVLSSRQGPHRLVDPPPVLTRASILRPVSAR